MEKIVIASAIGTDPDSYVAAAQGAGGQGGATGKPGITARGNPGNLGEAFVYFPEHDIQVARIAPAATKRVVSTAK